MRSLIKNKKAISDVVANVLIISLSVMAVSLLFSYISNLLALSQLSPTINCIQLRTEFDVCYNTENKEIEATIKPGLDEEITSFKLFSQEKSFVCGNSNGFSCTTQCSPPGKNEKTYYLPYDLKPNELSLVVEDCSSFPNTKTIQKC